MKLASCRLRNIINSTSVDQACLPTSSSLQKWVDKNIEMSLELSVFPVNNLNSLCSQSKTLTLKFKSNKSVAKPGFKATVTGKQSNAHVTWVMSHVGEFLFSFSHIVPQQLGKEDDGGNPLWPLTENGTHIILYSSLIWLT